MEDEYKNGKVDVSRHPGPAGIIWSNGGDS